MTKKEMKALVKKHGSKRAAARAIGMAESTFRDRFHGKPGKATNTKPAPAAIVAKSKKTLNDFRSVYDKSFLVPRKIRDGLKSLGAGWEYEVDFAKSIMVSLRDLGDFRDQFAEHVVQIREGRRVWSGSKSVADQMRRMI